MASDTREQFLDTAEALFAERGFYGVSIAAIASELDLTKQALLHHFGSKEKLYGEVLRRISDRFDAMGIDDSAADLDPGVRLKAYFLKLYEASTEETCQTRLLMRELLDNQQRANTAGTWYLKSFLQGLVGMLQDIPEWRDVNEPEALAVVYQLLGAINYFSISEPTLNGIFGPKMNADLHRAFPEQLERMLDAVLRRGAS